MSRAGRSSKPRVGVIGCGSFGAAVAMRLGEDGYPTTVFERHDRILAGASGNNLNRLHLGFHYPRDVTTARQCLEGYERFVSEFSDCTLGGFSNAYFIAESGSLTAPEAYLDFCRACGLPFRPIDVDRFEIGIRDVALGILTDEVVYDGAALRRAIMARLDRSGVAIRTRHDVASIGRTSGGLRIECANGTVCDVDVVVNCSYADINRLTAMLGHDVAPRQYEYTVMPVVRWRDAPVGVTIMDGPYCSVLPYGKTGDFLLYHVEHTVVSRRTAPFLDRGWLAPDRSPARGMAMATLFERTRAAATQFIPGLAGATCIGFLQGPRMTLADCDGSDARPSVVTAYGGGYITVFSGKIDHSVWVADEVLSLIA